MMTLLSHLLYRYEITCALYARQMYILLLAPMLDTEKLEIEKISQAPFLISGAGGAALVVIHLCLKLCLDKTNYPPQVPVYYLQRGSTGV